MDFSKDLIIYVSTSTYAIGWVLIQESVNISEHLIYYISKILAGPSINNNHDEKLDLVVVLSS